MLDPNLNVLEKFRIFRKQLEDMPTVSQHGCLVVHSIGEYQEQDTGSTMGNECQHGR